MGFGVFAMLFDNGIYKILRTLTKNKETQHAIRIKIVSQRERENDLRERNFLLFACSNI